MRLPIYNLTLVLLVCFVGQSTAIAQTANASERQRISLNSGWRFMKYASPEDADDLIYEVRPEVTDAQDDRPADAEPTEAVEVKASKKQLKDWILPTGNKFIADPSKRHKRPEGNPGGDFPFVQPSFDDSRWEAVDLPHDWAIGGPFMPGWEAPVGGGMGRLPSPGVAWYRRQLDIAEQDAGKSITLEIDGAMSYAMVWCNGNLVGGWPYGYASWQVDLTPYLVPGGENAIAIRLDNPPNSSRWYPGGGLYRNVWLTKTNPVHVGQWGTLVRTSNVSADEATIEFQVSLENEDSAAAGIELQTEFYALDEKGDVLGDAVAQLAKLQVDVPAGGIATASGSVVIANPRRWGPPPNQAPNLYVAMTRVIRDGVTIDDYQTTFGIRDLRFDPTLGIFVNDQRVYAQGVNQHHDLGALGAAYNHRAAERQLEMLREMGCNAIRMAHNPPAPELLELTDQMGFLVVNELGDVWKRKKTPLDHHLLYPDWHEQDLRALIRRDRNHPSVILWSLGNEVGEQFTGEAGAAVARPLQAIAKEEDPTRPTALSMNFSKPDMPLSAVADTINLNYQGEGIRNAPAYSHLQGIRTTPLYPAFHEKFPGKLILSSENAAALSSRGEYVFPVTGGISAPVEDGSGGDPERMHVSAYELYTAPFGSSADKVLGSLARHPYVAGGFVWSGWDYLGEPTPYYLARSSYFGIIDLAGFKKDRFFLYQAHWRPELPMAHLLPHWTWPERVGEKTPVHLFTSGDEAELFLNGKSLGRKQKGEFEFRLRWDGVLYEPGVIKAVAYKDGRVWATDSVRTAGAAARLELQPDRNLIAADGQDLSFVTVQVVDQAGLPVPRGNMQLRFHVEGPGELVATDNGDPTDLTSFHAAERNAFNGLCLVIVRAIPGQSGEIQLTATAEGLSDGTASIMTQIPANIQN